MVSAVSTTEPAPSSSMRRYTVLRHTWHVVGACVLVGVVAYLVWLLTNRREDLAQVLHEAHVVSLVVHVLLVFTYFTMVPLVWRMVIEASGVSPGPRALIASAFRPNLGKYIPGKLWSVAGRALILRQPAPTSASRAVLATLMQYGYEIAGACVFVAVYVWVVPAAPDAIAALAFPLLLVPIAALAPAPLVRRSWAPLRRMVSPLEFPDAPPTPRPMIIVVISVQWAVYAASGAALTSSLADLTLLTLVAVGAAFVVAWLAGFISLLTPGGLGVREGVAIALLAPMVGTDVAALATVVSRVTWTIVDGLTIAAGWAAVGRGSRLMAPGGGRKHRSAYNDLQ